MRKFGLFAVLAFGMACPSWAAPVDGAAAALNGFRGKMGRGALVVSPKLQKTAEAHANDMLKNNFFSHTGTGRTTIGKRARKNGYRFCLIAENIAKGQRSLAAVMDAWETSPGHRKNMLLNDVREFGLARVDDDIWVMVLGKPGC